jgi:hypothetical protein
LKKKIVIIFIVAIIGILLVNFSSDKSEKMKNAVFHVTLANPDLYINGVYAEKFTIDKGQYSFRFVPNGSSPEILSISINGKNFDFSENFKLQSALHETEISEYFTWEYEGEKIIEISEIQEVSIIINPNRNVMGSVSVDILEN